MLCVICSCWLANVMVLPDARPKSIIPPGHRSSMAWRSEPAPPSLAATTVIALLHVSARPAAVLGSTTSRGRPTTKCPAAGRPTAAAATTHEYDKKQAFSSSLPGSGTRSGSGQYTGYTKSALL